MTSDPVELNVLTVTAQLYVAVERQSQQGVTSPDTAASNSSSSSNNFCRYCPNCKQQADSTHDDDASISSSFAGSADDRSHEAYSSSNNVSDRQKVDAARAVSASSVSTVSCAGPTVKALWLFFKLWSYLQQADPGSFNKQSQIMLGSRHFIPSTIINLLVEAYLVYVLVTQPILWTAVNGMMVAFAVSTHAFLWCCMLKIDDTWYGPLVAELHMVIEFGTAVLTVALLPRTVVGAPAIELLQQSYDSIEWIVLFASFGVYVFVCVANAYQWGFFTRCRDKVIAAFASALVMHYPAGAIVTVCAIVVSAYGGPATGEAWMQVGVWVSHLCYEWYSVYVHNHSQRATIVCYGAQVCLTAWFIQRNEHY